ncbi:hypothetical protein T484DRAFT_1906436, partial [Baffinella frigidus]
MHRPVCGRRQRNMTFQSGRALLATVAVAFVGSAAARSPSHNDPPSQAGFAEVSNSGFDRRSFVGAPLPSSLVGLERIGKGPDRGLCRRGHGALCGGVPRGLSTRGRAVSPRAETRAELRNQMQPARGTPAAAAGAGAGAGLGRGERGLSVRAAASAAGTAASRSAAAIAAATAAARLSSVGKVGEEVVWESGVGALSVFELTKELPDPDDPAGGGEDGEGGGGGGGVDEGRGGPSSGSGTLGRSKRRTVRWHVTGSPLCNFTSVVVFAYDSRSRTCSLIREYAPGADKMLCSEARGCDATAPPRRHVDAMHAAREELNEEAGLQGGTWYQLSQRGVPKDKYSKDRLVPFLVVDGNIDPTPRPQ